MSAFLTLGQIEFIISSFENNILLTSANRIEGVPEIGEAIFQARNKNIIDVIATEVDICLITKKGLTNKLIEELEKINYTLTPVDGKSWSLPVCFDLEEDWSSVEKHTRFTRDEYLSRLLDQKLLMKMYGFAPGFLYISGMESSLHCPRKRTPTSQVKSGSIAIGGPYLGLYSLPTPAGWHVIGRTPLTVLNIREMPPIPIRPGDRIILKSIEMEEFNRIEKSNQNLITYND